MTPLHLASQNSVIITAVGITSCLSHLSGTIHSSSFISNSTPANSLPSSVVRQVKRAPSFSRTSLIAFTFSMPGTFGPFSKLLTVLKPTPLSAASFSCFIPRPPRAAPNCFLCIMNSIVTKLTENVNQLTNNIYNSNIKTNKVTKIVDVNSLMSYARPTNKTAPNSGATLKGPNHKNRRG